MRFFSLSCSGVFLVDQVACVVHGVLIVLAGLFMQFGFFLKKESFFFRMHQVALVVSCVWGCSRFFYVVSGCFRWLRLFKSSLGFPIVSKLFQIFQFSSLRSVKSLRLYWAAEVSCVAYFFWKKRIQIVSGCCEKLHVVLSCWFWYVVGCFEMF